VNGSGVGTLVPKGAIYEHIKLVQFLAGNVML